MLLSAAALELICYAKRLYYKQRTRKEAINTMRLLVQLLQGRLGIAHKAVLPVAFELATMLQAHGTCDKAIVVEAEGLFSRLFEELEMRHGIQHKDTLQTALTLGKIKHQRKHIHGIAADPEAEVWAATVVKRLGSALTPTSDIVMGTSSAFQELIPSFKPGSDVQEDKEDPLAGIDPDLLAYLTDGETGGEEDDIWNMDEDDDVSR
jgi:hypothetical protein